MCDTASHISCRVAVGKLPSSLVVLDLTNNSISGSLPDFSSASELGVVNMDVNQLEGTLPSSFGAAARSLVQIRLAANRLTGKVGDTKWEELTELATLALDENNMGGKAQTGRWHGAKQGMLLQIALGNCHRAGNMIHFRKACSLCNLMLEDALLAEFL